MIRDVCCNGRLRLGSLGDFFSRIPSGHLGNLPSHLKVCFDATNELYYADIIRAANGIV
jgi:hypothetical protein